MLGTPNGWITAISLGITAIVMLLAGRITYPSFKKTKDRLLGYFCVFFFGFGIMHIFLAVGGYFSGINSQIAGILYLIAHYILFFTLATFLSFPTVITFPKLEKPLFYVLLFLALLSSAGISLHPPLPTATPSGLTMWNVPPATMKIVVSYTTIALVAAVILFIVALLKAPERIYKFRFILFILGILVFLTAGPLHNFAKTVGQYLLADSLTPLGTLIMLFGVLLPKIFKKK